MAAGYTPTEEEHTDNARNFVGNHFAYVLGIKTGYNTSTISDEEQKKYEPRPRVVKMSVNNTTVDYDKFHRTNAHHQHTTVDYHKCRLLETFLCRSRTNVHHPHTCVDQWTHCIQLTGRVESDYAMLLNGSFILELFCKWRDVDEDPDILFQENSKTTIIFDLLLPENQIPFHVIEDLYKLVVTDDERSNRDAFLTHLAIFLMNEKPSKILPVRWTNNQIDDLLDLYHKYLLLVIPTTLLCPDEQKHEPTTSLLPLWQISSRSNQRGANRPPQRIPSAVELYKSGIKFKKKQLPTHFMDVTFNKGILKIPLLQIDEDKKALLHSLTVRERQKTSKEKVVTSYVVLIDSLIDTKEDVTLFQRTGVIQNMLSTL